jgi:hypothetical protein
MKLRIPPTVAGVALFLVVAGAAYVGAYLYLPHHLTGDKNDPKYLIRVYVHRWQADLFQPAAKIESLLTGGTVVADQYSEVDAEP